MLVIVGCIVVIGSVLGGFTIAGGHIHALIHPSELLTIGGSALGALIIMAPMKVIKDLIKGIISTIKGSPFNKAAYVELLKLMYHLLRLARRDGMLALEGHIRDPHASEIFQKYPKVANNHHASTFICGMLAPLMDASITPERLNDLAEIELRSMEEEHHAPMSVLAKTADRMPGFGIVAAVLGIVITMGAIDGPVEEIGHKVGAALVGTFLGILLSYGFLAPLVVNMEFLGHAELAFFRAIAKIVDGFAQSLPPKVVIEVARRGMPSEVRPTEQELEELFKAVESS
ncbi:MAG: flagellar motor stator protein MotA [Planctomycetes bacterium]|nr:flagellar motor stator protein MotA [Planctomycetota bacterium]